MELFYELYLVRLDFFINLFNRHVKCKWLMHRIKDIIRNLADISCHALKRIFDKWVIEVELSLFLLNVAKFQMVKNSIFWILM